MTSRRACGRCMTPFPVSGSEDNSCWGDGCWIEEVIRAAAAIGAELAYEDAAGIADAFIGISPEKAVVHIRARAAAKRSGGEP